MRMFRCVIVVLTVLTCTAIPLAAQVADDGLGALRAKTPLADEDRATIRAWIVERVGQVVGEDLASAQAAFAQLRTGFTGGNDFKEAYVLACTGAIGSAFKKAPRDQATRLITLFCTVSDLRALDVLLDALRDDRAALRAAAAVALRTLQPKLAGNAETFGRTIDALREAGKKERAVKTLELIYRALDYRSAQSASDRRTSATAVLTILEQRAEQAAGGTLRAEGADRVGLEVAGASRAALDDPGRERYTKVLARLLHHAVRRYTGGEDPLLKVDDKTASDDTIALRNSTELLIKTAEEQLAGILKPAAAPKITEAMLAAQPTEMVIAMNQWAGLIKTATGLELPDVQRPPEPEGEQERP